MAAPARVVHGKGVAMTEIVLVNTVVAVYLSVCYLALYRKGQIAGWLRIRSAISAALAGGAILLAVVPAILDGAAMLDSGSLFLCELGCIVVLWMAILILPFGVYYPWVSIINRRAGRGKLAPKEYRTSLFVTLFVILFLLCSVGIFVMVASIY